MQDDKMQELTIDHSCHLRTQAAQPHCSRNSVPSKVHTHREPQQKRQDMSGCVGHWALMRHPQRLPEVTGGDSTQALSFHSHLVVAPWGHLDWTGTAPLFLFKVTMISRYLCSEKFKRFGLLKLSQGFYILQSKLENCLNSFISPQL